MSVLLQQYFAHIGTDGNLKPHKNLLLFEYLLLCSLEIKKGFLFDIARPNLKQVQSAIVASGKKSLMIVKLCDDIIVISSEYLHRKLQNLWDTKYIDDSIIVKINHESLQICTTEEVGLLVEIILRVFVEFYRGYAEYCACNLEVPTVVSVAEEHRYFFPFLAGWLIGYPCIYTQMEMNSSFDNLSMVTLRKLAIQARLNSGFRPSNKFNTGTSDKDMSNSQLLDILVFTVPSLLYEDHQVRIDELVSARLRELQSLTNRYFGSADLQLTFTTECITAPVVSL